MEARICTFECTFCADCVDKVLHDVCPNCGGGFEKRPIRPGHEWRAGLSTIIRPPSTKRVHLSFTREEITEFSNRIRNIKPENR
jgi:uncharacterized protein